VFDTVWWIEYLSLATYALTVAPIMSVLVIQAKVFWIVVGLISCRAALGFTSFTKRQRHRQTDCPGVRKTVRFGCGSGDYENFKLTSFEANYLILYV